MKQTEYLILEYQSCQSKITRAVEHLFQIELYVLIGISALYAWVYGGERGEIPAVFGIEVVLFLPPLLVCLALHRSIMQIKYIRTISDYLRHIETRLSQLSNDGHPWEHVGWETWSSKKGPFKWNNDYRFILWPGLFVGTVIAAMLKTGGP